MSFGYYIPVAGVVREPVVVGDAPVQAGPFNAATQLVRIRVEGDVRATFDGSVPTATNGHLFYDGAQFDENPATATALKFVALEAGGSAVLWITELLWFEEEEGAEVHYPAVSFRQMLHEIIRGEGRDPSSNSLTAVQLEERAGMIADAVNEAWEVWWPRLIYAEQRTAEGALIEWQQDGHARQIGRVQGVYRTDPQADGDALEVPFRIVPRGVKLPDGTAVGWVQFMEPAPEFTAVEHDGAATYEADARVLDPADGNCYRALVENQGRTPSEYPSCWALQAVPKFLKKYVRLAVLARLMSEGDGRWNYYRDAMNEMERLIVAETDGQEQGQVSGVRV